jgi:hypothetical protein
MAGVQGLGQRVLAGARSPHAQALAADLDHLGMQVTPENVLQIRNVLKAEAVRLAAVMGANDYKLRVGPCGADPVSDDASRGFNAKIDRLKAQCYGYIDALDGAVKLLEQTAATYGLSEQEIEGSFRSFHPERPPEQLVSPMAPSEYSPQASLLRSYRPTLRADSDLSPLVKPRDQVGGWQ